MEIPNNRQFVVEVVEDLRGVSDLVSPSAITSAHRKGLAVARVLTEENRPPSHLVGICSVVALHELVDGVVGYSPGEQTKTPTVLDEVSQTFPEVHPAGLGLIAVAKGWGTGSHNNAELGRRLGMSREGARRRQDATLTVMYKTDPETTEQLGYLPSGVNADPRPQDWARAKIYAAGRHSARAIGAQEGVTKTTVINSVNRVTTALRKDPDLDPDLHASLVAASTDVHRAYGRVEAIRDLQSRYGQEQPPVEQLHISRTVTYLTGLVSGVYKTQEEIATGQGVSRNAVSKSVEKTITAALQRPDQYPVVKGLLDRILTTDTET